MQLQPMIPFHVHIRQKQREKQIGFFPELFFIYQITLYLCCF